MLGNVASSDAGYVGLAVGGGIYCDWATIENNTIVGNLARCLGSSYLISGGGLAAGPDNTVLNNIIWDNWADSSAQIYGQPQVTYSCIAGGWSGIGSFDLDPQFCGPLYGDYHISAQSPCVSGGYNGTRVGAFEVGCDNEAVISDPVTPNDFRLYGCYPNPFNMATTISFDLFTTGHVRITVYDLTGSLVETVVEAGIQAGYHEITWSPKDISSGIYFCNISTGNFSQTQKMLLVK